MQPPAWLSGQVDLGFRSFPGYRSFLIVCGAVLIMRRTHPEVPRPFRAPFGPVMPVLGILSCLLLMFSLPAENWIRLFVWLAIGLVIYFAYGRKHSAAARGWPKA